MAQKRTHRELKAMAYALVDEIETRTNAIQKRYPKLPRDACFLRAVEEMSK